MVPVYRNKYVIGMLTCLVVGSFIWMTLVSTTNLRNTVSVAGLASSWSQTLTNRWSGHKVDMNNTDSVRFDTTLADELKSKVRVLCVILTMPQALKTSANIIRKTWAKRCNKYFFMANTKESYPDVITSDMEESRINLIFKVVHAFKYIYANHMDDFDWILKADDDTYVVVENLRYLLSHYNSAEPGYLGYHFNKYVHTGYMSGGAGYVISKPAFAKLMRMLTNKTKNTCELGVQKYNPEKSEDLELGRCLDMLGVPVLSSVDTQQRETFHPYPVQQYLTGTLPQYLYSWAMNPPQVGPECCSQFTISFHYMKPEGMALVDHLLYSTSVYGRSLPKDLQHVFKIGHVQHKNHT